MQIRKVGPLWMIHEMCGKDALRYAKASINTNRIASRQTKRSNIYIDKRILIVKVLPSLRAEGSPFISPWQIWHSFMVLLIPFEVQVPEC